jgi:predicted helicase
MDSEPLKLILKSNDWNHFVSCLSEFGNAPEYKKLKGEAFEYLTKFYLQLDPVFSLKFKNVLHHSELPITIRDKLKLPHPEVGVDLIAECYDGLYYAIQCKFHQDASSNVTYDELSTFFSVTERNETNNNLSHRLICTSAFKVSSNVQKLHPNKLGYLTHQDFSTLNQDSFQKIHALIKGQRPIFRPLIPRKHQTKAISRASEYFNGQLQSRGKIIHPCGAGKSLTAYWVAKNLSSRTILIAVPSLSLVRQTLNAWSHQALADQQEIDYVAVCSDKDVGQADDPLMNSHELGISVTTNVHEVKKFLQSDNSAMKVLLTTYQSGQVVVSAAKELQFEFDLGIFDEAHKTTGDRTKKFALLLDDNEIRIQRKIFMTATERQFSGDSTNLLSMDDEIIYGEVIDQLSFRSALEENPPILCDYKVITLSITRKEIERLIIENSLTKANGKTFTFTEDSTTIAALIAHRKLSQERGIKHAISFHKSIKRAKEFTELNDLINSKGTSGQKVHSFHVSGTMGTSDRNFEIERFRKNAPSIISNARCLTEGVDIPSVDAVVFADPKQSLIDIVQAAGRAMRIHPTKSLGYIIIPVVIDDGNEEKINDAFRQLVNVVAALGINDERIIDEAKLAVKTNTFNSGNILEFEEFLPTEELEFETFIRELQIKIWDRVSFARSVVGETEFNKWMQSHTDLSEASMEKYTRVVRKISNDLVKLNLAYSSLEEITEKADLERLKDDYFAIDEYRDLDKRGNRMYSAGFNMLVKFQKSKNL